MALNPASPFGVIIKIFLLVQALVLLPIHILEFVAEVFKSMWTLKVEIGIAVALWLVSTGLVTYQQEVMLAVSSVYETVLYPMLEFTVNNVLVPLKYLIVGNGGSGGFQGLRPIWNLAWEIYAMVRLVMLNFFVSLIQDPRFTQMITDIFSLIQFIFSPTAATADLAQDLSELLVDAFFLGIDFVMLLIKFFTLTAGAPGIFYPGSDSDAAWSTWGSQLLSWIGAFFEMLWDFFWQIIWQILERLLAFIFNIWNAIVGAFQCVINLGDCICNPGNYFPGAQTLPIFAIFCPSRDMNPTDLEMAVRNYTLAKLGLDETTARNGTAVNDAFTIWTMSLVNREVPAPRGSQCAMMNDVRILEHTRLAPADQLTYVGCAAAYYAGLEVSSLTVGEYELNHTSTAIVPMTVKDSLIAYRSLTGSLTNAIGSSLRTLTSVENNLVGELQMLRAYSLAFNTTDEPKTKLDEMLDRMAASIENSFETHKPTNPFAAAILGPLSRRVASQLRSSFSLSAQYMLKLDQLEATQQLASRVAMFGMLLNNATKLMEKVRTTLYQSPVLPQEASGPSTTATATEIMPLSELKPVDITSETDPQKVAYMQNLAVAGVFKRIGDIYEFSRSKWQELANETRTGGNSSSYAALQTQFVKTPFGGIRPAVVPANYTPPASGSSNETVPITSSVLGILRPQYTTEKDEGNIQTVVIAIVEGIAHIFDPTWTWTPSAVFEGPLGWFTNMNVNHKICNTDGVDHWCWWDPDRLGLMYYLNHLIGPCETAESTPSTYDGPGAYAPYYAPSGGWRGYSLDPHPQLGYTLYSLQCIPRLPGNALDWLVPLPTEFLQTRFMPFFDLCTYTPAPGVPCTSYLSCRDDLGFYDAMDNIVFFFEQLKTWTAGDVNIADWMRDDATFNQIVDALGLTNYISASLQNFNFHGLPATTGYWACWTYTLLQVGLMYSFVWVGFLVAKASVPAFMKLIGIFNNILQLLVAFMLFQRQKALIEFANELENKTDKLERDAKQDEDEQQYPAAATAEEPPVRWTRRRNSLSNGEVPRWERAARGTATVGARIRPAETTYVPDPVDSSKGYTALRAVD